MLYRFTTGICATSALEVEHDLQYWRSLRAPSFTLRFEPLHLRNGDFARYIRSLPKRFRLAFRPPEINIFARSQEQADVAALLLYASHAIIDCCVHPLAGWDPYVAERIAARPKPPSKGTKQQGLCSRIQFAGAVDVAGLAVKLARRKFLTDSAFYFLASVYSVSSHPMDLHPRYGNETIPRQHNPMHRVWEAQGLFAAYQAIDTLGLAVKGASSKNPSVRNGEWDPAIRADLEARLSAIGVTPAQTIVWHRRGSSTGIQRQLQRRTTAATNAHWNWGAIRDQEIPIVDAINHAHWLRSNVSAHRSQKRLSQLHPIDVINVQHLARLLIMNAAAFPWWSQREGRQLT